jgi:hypothetical protein
VGKEVRRFGSRLVRIKDEGGLEREMAGAGLVAQLEKRRSVMGMIKRKVDIDGAMVAQGQ